MSRRIRSNFTLGGAVAEHDQYLLEAYVDNGTYEAIASRNSSKCLIIGRTGSGKSAVLTLLEHNQSNKVIRIAPEDLALTYITNLDIMPRLLELGVQLDPFLKALWKHVFIVEILRHRYVITTPEQKQSIIAQLRERFKRDPGKVAAVDYLSEFGDKFWCETHERVREIAYTLEQKFVASGELNASAGLAGAKTSVGAQHAETRGLRSELVNTYQRIVNEVQIPRLNKMLQVLDRDILDNQHFVYIIIDDLDRDWVDEQFVNLLIHW